MSLRKLKSKTTRREEVLEGIFKAFSEDFKDDFLAEDISVIKAECFKKLYGIAREQFLQEGNSKKKTEELTGTCLKFVSEFEQICDIEFCFNGYEICILVGRGMDEKTFQDHLGRTTLASMVFDFTCSIFIDLSPDKSLVEFLKDEEVNGGLLENLWELHNIRLYGK